MEAPSQPDAPLTTISGTSVVVTWSAPSNNGGVAVSSYIVKFRTSDNVTYEESTDICNGGNLLIVGLRNCTIPQA